MSITAKKKGPAIYCPETANKVSVVSIHSLDVAL